MNYHEFLNTRFWLSLSSKKKILTPFCEVCKTTENLQCHHLFYRKNWFQTKIEDLIILCKSCHEGKHFLYIKGKRGILKKILRKDYKKKKTNILVNRRGTHYSFNKERFVSYDKYAKEKYGLDYQDKIYNREFGWG